MRTNKSPETRSQQHLPLATELPWKRSDGIKPAWAGEFCVCTPKAILAVINMDHPTRCDAFPWYCPFARRD